eukprot:3238560-Pleurochrysis_carterae.AAC.1
MRSALAQLGAASVTFAQCALGAPVRKFTTAAMSAGAEAFAGELATARCVHGREGHPEVAHGRDAHGAS